MFRFKCKSNAEKVIDRFRNDYPMNTVSNDQALSNVLMKKGLLRKNLDYIQRKPNNTSKVEDQSSMSNSSLSPAHKSKLIKIQPAAHLFPTFHDKTMFKAAVEHSLGSLDRRNYRSRTVERMAGRKKESPGTLQSISDVQNLKTDYSVVGKIPIKVMPAKVSSKQL